LPQIKRTGREGKGQQLLILGVKRRGTGGSKRGFQKFGGSGREEGPYGQRGGPYYVPWKDSRDRGNVFSLYEWVGQLSKSQFSGKRRAGDGRWCETSGMGQEGTTAMKTRRRVARDKGDHPLGQAGGGERMKGRKG